MKPTVVDWVALGIIVVGALGGMRRGLVVTALSLAGLVAGAYAGSRAAPHLLGGGSSSAWAALASLVGAVIGAALLWTVAGMVGSMLRGGLRLTPLRLLDSLGGLLVGAAFGLVLVWVLSATALLVPHQTSMRREVLRSSFVRRLDQAVPPRRLLNLLARIDPFPAIAGPVPPAAPLHTKLAGSAAVRRAAQDVVRVLGTACGVGIEGSGWFVRPDLVVTAAHVVAGEHDTGIVIPGEANIRPVQVVAFDAHNDVAVLRVSGRPAAFALPLADPSRGAAVAIVGYPEDGPLTGSPGRIGATSSALSRDAYGNGPVIRTITAVGGAIRHGDSGAPGIDADGAVETTIFAARIGAPGGYGVPASVVRGVLASAGAAPVSTGACAG